MRTKTGERLDRIHDLVVTGESRVEELSRRLGVSTSTVRRDLARLTEQGRIARTYGGAMLTPHLPEPSLRERTRVAPAAKDAIARVAPTTSRIEAARSADSAHTNTAGHRPPRPRA